MKKISIENKELFHSAVQKYKKQGMFLLKTLIELNFDRSIRLGTNPEYGYLGGLERVGLLNESWEYQIIGGSVIFTNINTGETLDVVCVINIDEREIVVDHWHFGSFIESNPKYDTIKEYCEDINVLEQLIKWSEN